MDNHTRLAGNVTLLKSQLQRLRSDGHASTDVESLTRAVEILTEAVDYLLTQRPKSPVIPAQQARL